MTANGPCPPFVPLTAANPPGCAPLAIGQVTFAGPWTPPDVDSRTLDDVKKGFPTAWVSAPSPPYKTELHLAAEALYFAGEWKLSYMPDDQQAAMWKRLREALGLPAGASTLAGLGR